ncbi:MAG: DUF3500 domain-containing protein [Verrucomicrobia bacterium]|nr:DUF3500 domain-containing protein [Verrucomicrobiota bacterium]
MNPSSILTAIAVLILSIPHARAHEAAQQMADVANAFLNTLSAEQKSKALFNFSDNERENWHFIPRERQGLALREMTPEQKLLGHALLNAGLSNRGQLLASTIMSLEEVLYQIEGDANPSKRDATREKRHPEKYYLSIFGAPAMTGAWGWRVEGHHLSLNFTIKDGTLLRATPSFFGSNPGEVRTGPRAGTRILALEEDLGRAFAKSLTADQWKMALVETTAPKEMITEAKHHVDPLSPAGISETNLQPEQKTALRQIIHEYLFRVRPDIAEERWQVIESTGPVNFAWAGDLEKGKPHYYRVQGGSFLLEYDNTQNDANHVHTVWRDFAGDFGSDILDAHVKSEHK